jgi:GAF domain-containing protein
MIQTMKSGAFLFSCMRREAAMSTNIPSTNPPPRAPQPHKDYYQALYQAAITISSSLELNQVLQGIVTSTAEAMQVKACVLRLLDAEADQLPLSAVYGLSDEYLSKGPVKVASSALDRETLCGEPISIPDVRTDPRFQYQEAAKHEGIVSALCVPLEVHGRAIGVMRVYTAEPTDFHEDDVQFLSVLASLSALAIENARLYENIKSSYHGVMSAFWGTSILP